MRQVVVKDVISDATAGTLTGRVFFRYPIPQTRQAEYANATFTPEAPGDYAGAHADELTALRAGEWVERLSPNQRSFPSTTTDAELQAAIVQDYQIAAAAFAKSEDARFSRWGSSWDGTLDASGNPVWSMTSL